MNRPAPSAEFDLPYEEITVAGMRLRCSRFPSLPAEGRRTLICLPGYGATGESFARLRPLAAGTDVTMLTFPEEACRGNDPVADFAGAVAEFARRFDRPIVLGTSFGGLVAIETAARLGEDASAVVLISTFSMHPRGRLLLRGSWLIRLFEALIPAIEPVGVRFLAGANVDDVASRELRRETHTITRREKHARLMASLRADLRQRARRIAVPALIIQGDRDPLVPMQAARDLAEALPNAEMIVIRGAGHLPYITHADEVNAAMAQFLSTTLPPTAPARRTSGK